MRRNLVFWITSQIAIWVYIGSASAAGPAVFALSSVDKAVEVGQTFSVNLNINPGTASVDTARAHLTFSSNLITADSFVLTGKLSSASPGNNIDNSSGSLSGGGFTVNNSINSPSSLAKIVFRANAVGTAAISVQRDSKLISNGEEVGNPSGFNSITVQIGPSTLAPGAVLQLTSPTHPDQTKWYQSNAVQFKWADIGGRQYKWDLDQSPNTLPTQPISDRQKQVRNVKPGIWYFHLSAPMASVPNGLAVAHYKVQIDNVKPNPIEPYLDVSDSKNLALKFTTTDYHSGMASYDITVNQTPVENVTSPYVLRGLNVGNNLISVVGYDQAGNARSGWIKFKLNPDGTIQDIITSVGGNGFCDTMPWLCNGSWPIKAIGGLIVVFLLILLLVHQRFTLFNVKTVIHTTTKTNPKTGKELITESVTKTEDTLGVKANSEAVEETPPTPPHHKKKHES